MNKYWNLLGIENLGWRRLWVILNVILIIGSIYMGLEEGTDYYYSYNSTKIYTYKSSRIIRYSSNYLMITIGGVNIIMIIINWVVKGFKEE
tara:strand:- start:266 stop:538 length:273 start_codon:yes stop_codon:yes gene_type:complete